MVTKLRNLQKVLTVPAAYRFFQLPAPYEHSSWYSFSDLEIAIIEMFKSQGCKVSDDFVAPSYVSFAIFFIEECLGKFIWLEIFNDSDNDSRLCLSNNPDCDFADLGDRKLFVPVPWGEFVLGLARRGIREIRKTEEDRWEALRWNGEMMEYNDFAGREVQTITTSLAGLVEGFDPKIPRFRRYALS